MLEKVNAQDIKKIPVSACCNFLQEKILQIKIQSDYVFAALDSKYLMVSIFLPYNWYMHIPKITANLLTFTTEI